MNQEIKARWLEALRSGEFKQTNGYLSIQSAIPDDDQFDGYCCLGVLCEIAVADGVVVKQRVGENSFFEYGNPEKDDWDYSVLPLSVREWAGLQEANPSVNALDKDADADLMDFWCPISEPNDNGSTFSQIADWIENDL